MHGSWREGGIYLSYTTHFKLPGLLLIWLFA
jgi:hypothetical protein